MRAHAHAVNAPRPGRPKPLSLLPLMFLISLGGGRPASADSPFRRVLGRKLSVITVTLLGGRRMALRLTGMQTMKRF